jgi:hypothetical protein
MGEGVDTVSTIQAFKTVADNPLTRYILRRSLNIVQEIRPIGLKLP